MSDENTATSTEDPVEEERNEVAELAADAILFGHKPSTGVLMVLLVQRRWPPHAGRWALPGGKLNIGEDDAAAAARECAEETGVRPQSLRYVGSYRAPGRDARGRIASWAWSEFRDQLDTPKPADDAVDARWFPVFATVLSNTAPDLLAFDDHEQMIRDAVAVHHPQPTAPIGDDSEQLRAAYAARAHWAAVAIAPYAEHARLACNDPAMPGMPVLYANTPEGQISMHVHPADLGVFVEHAGVRWADDGDELTRWDRHSTPEAMDRLCRLAARASGMDSTDAWKWRYDRENW